MGNLYVDLFKKSKVKVYTGLGLGATTLTEDVKSTTGFSLDNVRYTKTVFTYGIHFGFGFNITKGLEGDIGAHCMRIAVPSTKFGICSASIGGRYEF
jgi:opacity protein-like surface antigen